VGVSAPEPLCRLCEGRLIRQFRLAVLNKHDVQYFECGDCGSLQTEPPYWLDEAYGVNLSSLDTGAVQRNLQNLAAAYVLSRLFNARDAIDFGGGDGLLCRLLRDYGVNCFVRDRYAAPTYGQGFSQPNFTVPTLMTAFEVVEHFANPSSELVQLFSPRPKVLLVGTFVYKNQSKDWWYIAAEAGQHVFFYSPDAIRWIADQYGYSSMLVADYVLFVQEPLLTPLKRVLVRILLNRIVCRLIRGLILIMPAPGAWRDHLSAKSRSREK
jgi:hypothetical protein